MRNLVIAAVVCSMAVACVPKEQFETKVLEAEESNRKFKNESERAKECDAKLQTLQPRLAELEKSKAMCDERLPALDEQVKTVSAQLTDKEAERRALFEQNAQLTALVDELSKSTKKLAKAKEELEKRSSEYESLASSLKDEIKSGKIELSELKGKMTVKLKDKILFSSGSVRIDKEGQAALTKIAKTLATVKGRIIRVEGHTDDVPTDPKGSYPSNWELSLARSMAVVKVLQDAKVDPTILSAAGYGQYQPIAKNNTPENRSANRRIEIVLAVAK
ncbi:MAG: OmpA/MotB family protein [Myxococcaceae bacterium]